MQWGCYLRKHMKIVGPHSWGESSVVTVLYGREGYRKYVSWLVAGDRYELYSQYPLYIQAVAVSIPLRDDALRSADRS
jgi:hypothetical protein